MLPISLRRELDRMSAMVRELDAIAPGEDASDDEKYAYQDKTADLIIKTSLFLDKVMNRIWERHHEKDATARKANVYFPACESREKFDEALRRMQLASLPERAPGLADVLWRAQPRPADASWLRSLKSLAGLRHERQPEIEESRLKLIAPDLIAPDRAGGMQIGMFTVGENGELTDDRAGWARWSEQLSAAGKTDAEIEATRLPIRDYTARILEETGRDPVVFCAACVRDIRALTVAVFQHLD